MNSEPDSGSKRCPRCNEDLPIGEFGISRTRKSGRNIYCKRCNREKTNESRADTREMRARQSAARGKGGIPPAPQSDETTIDPLLPDAEMVLTALGRGPMTQKEIVKAAKLTADKVGEALAELMLDKKEVAVTDSEPRTYYLVRKAKEAA